MTLDRWQADAAFCLLGKDSTGLYAADTVVLSIPRQVGKTFLVGALVFADCIVNPGTTVVWTAHRFTVARETFNELKALAESPQLAPHIDPDDITTGAGNETIPFRNGSRIVFKARERGSVRGFSKVRRLILDEAQILTEATMADLVPTMNQAKNPQIILMGTPPKPNDPGQTFTSLRSEALEGISEGVVYVEFSAPLDCDPDDREAWGVANPSLLNGRTPARAIVRLRKLLTNDDDFRREALGIWDEGGGGTAIDPTAWAALADPSAERGSPVAFGVAVHPDRLWATVAVAWRRPDGHVQVMTARNDRTTAWVADEVARLQSTWGGSVVASSTAKELVPGATVTSPAGQVTADSALFDAVAARTLHHGNQGELNTAISGHRWKPTGGFAPKGNVDISPLTAAALAVHAVTAEPKNRPGRFVAF